MALKALALDIPALERIVGPRGVVTDPISLLTYEGDASLDKGSPDVVVLPRSAAEVAQVVQWARANGMPIVARGAGTGLSGGAVAEHGGVVMPFSHMEQIGPIDEGGRSVSVQPGAINLLLDTAAKAKGLYFPPDPSSGRASTLGGNLGENAGGPHCFKYGVMTNYVTGLEVVLADGKIVRFGGGALDYPEYDFVGLLTGSEGTLGIITEAQLRLIRNPPAVKTLMAAFDSVEAAGAAVSAIIAQGLVPATLEMMDQKIMRILEDFAHAGLPVEAGAGLIVEVDGYPQSVGPQIDAASEILLANGGFDLRVARSEEERAKIWLGRKSAAGAMARLAPAYYLVDGTVPRSKLAETLAGVNRICEAYDLRVGYVFHAGDGNLHPLILIPNPKDKAFVQRVIDAGRDILELCISHDGSITGEHGVGIEKRAFMPLMFSSTELAVMREIKTLFDPDGVLNPGKIFPEEESQTPIADRQSPIADRQSPISNLQSPQSPEEAAELLQACAAAGKTVRIRGGGSKSAHLPAADVTLSTGCMRGVKKLALEDLYVTVGAGTPLAELQAALAEHGMWVPLVSPWPEATLGGIVSTAFNGPLRMRYGGVRDLLLAATVVLADGRTIRAGRPVVKNVAGYDMPKLIAGAHGTLGLLCDVTLKLLPLPRASESLHVPLASLDDGLALAERLLRECLVGSALLLVQTGDRRPETGNGRPETGDRRPETGDRRPETGANERSITSSRQTALVYTAEGVVEDVAAELAQVQTALGSRESNASTEAGSDTWATWLRETTASGATVVRVGVPTRELPGLLRELAPTLRDASFVADMASGLLYTAGAAVEELRSAAVRRGGYAIVLQGAAGAAGTWGHTPGGLPLMRALKECWDGQGLLNPGAFVV